MNEKDWIQELKETADKDYDIDMSKAPCLDKTYSFEYDTKERITRVDLKDYTRSDSVETKTVAEFQYKEFENGDLEVSGYGDIGDMKELFYSPEDNGNKCTEILDNKGLTKQFTTNGETTNYYYDDYGRLSEILYDSGDRYKYEYNDKGELVSEITCPKNGEEYIYWRYKYDDAGNVVSKSRTSHIDHNKIYTTIYYTYDEKGRCIERSKTHHIEEMKYTYSEDGSLVFERHFEMDGISYDCAYKYNNDGSIEEIFAVNEDAAIVTKFTYSNGLLVKRDEYSYLPR